MSHSRLICFDAAGTLIEPAVPVDQIYAEFAWQFGIKIERACIRERFGHYFSRLFRLHTETDETLERLCWRQLVDAVLDAPPNADAIFEALHGYYHEPASWRVRPSILNRLRDESAAGNEVAIASNFDSRLERIITHHVPEVPPARVFYSTRIGVRKPDPRFFQYIEARTGRPPEECTLIGDESEADIVGAERAGWRAEKV